MTEPAAPPVCYRHPGVETYVSCTRCERPICPDCMRPAAVGFQCPSCVKEGSATLRPIMAAYGGRARPNPEVTYALLGLNVLMFLLTIGTGAAIGLGGGNLTELFRDLALVSEAQSIGADGFPTVVGVAHGQYYRLLTSMFLHFGIIHLALNMYCLFLVGPTLERALGRLRFTALYLLSGLGGSALSYALGPTSQIAAGASGAVFGLFAAYYVLERKRGSDVSQIAVTIAINLAFGFVVPYIDWRGHVGGLIAGALVTTALVHAPAGKQRWLYQALGCVAVALLVAAVVGARTVQLTT